jgi:DNA-binding NarL/FixJ family response regulator
MLTGVSRVATASTLSAALELLRTGDFSLALVDEGSADAAGTDVIAAMRRELPEVDSILMTPRHSFGLAVPAAIAGARGIVEKPIDLGQFGAALREVREGHLFFVRRPLAEILARSRPAPPIAVALTPPEIDVLRGVFAGMSTAEIAADRGKSPDTVKTQIADGSKKLGVTSREEAAREARRLGIL